ncbi:MAG: glycosyltransferase family 4 protein [Candidatus Omnitrophica bacterium]|nr:glycosyltransferase family 4 protein [Candidatus Omnitrophota bacterium]
MSKKVLFLHQSWKGFEKRDFKFLKENYETKEVLLYKRFTVKTFVSLKKLFFSDIIVCWFAYRSALLFLILAKIVKKKIIVIMGGWECANESKISYGMMQPGARFFLNRLIVKTIAKLADIVVAVSEYNRQEIINNVRVNPNKIRLIYNGVESDSRYANCKKEKIVLTVAEVTKSNMQRKGLQIFIDAARSLPQWRFILAGKVEKTMQEIIKFNKPANLELKGYLSDDDLSCLYGKSQVYVQASFHEQFACSLVEAMLYKCVPVVTDKAALPEVVGDTGYFLSYGSLIELKAAIGLAMNDDQKGFLARKRALENFSLAQRENKLRELINNLNKK